MPLSRCNNSSSRYTRENHYALLAQSKISQVSYCKISITLLIIFQNVVQTISLHRQR